MKKVISLLVASAALVVYGMANAAGKPECPPDKCKVFEASEASKSLASANVLRYTVNTAINDTWSYSGQGTQIKMINRSLVQESVTVNFFNGDGSAACSVGPVTINPNQSLVFGSNLSWYAYTYPYPDWIASSCNWIYGGYAEIWSTTPKLQIDAFIVNIEYSSDDLWTLLDREVTPVRVEKKKTATIGD